MHARTIELLQHALHGAGAAAAGHGDLKLVVVFRHGGGVVCCVSVQSRMKWAGGVGGACEGAEGMWMWILRLTWEAGRFICWRTA
jgi:hypothetical protein